MRLLCVKILSGNRNLEACTGLLAFPDQIGFFGCQGHFQSTFITCKKYKTYISFVELVLCSYYGEQGIVSVKYLFGLVVRRGWANGLRPSKTFVLAGNFLTMA